MAVLLSFGHGYSARALTPVLIDRGWEVIGTTRTPEKAEVLRAEGVEPMIFGDRMEAALGRATHLLVSAAPDDEGDPVLRAMARACGRCCGGGSGSATCRPPASMAITAATGSTRTTPLTPSTARGQARVAAEAAWRGSGRSGPRCISSGWRGSTGRGAARSRRCGPAPRGGS